MLADVYKLRYPNIYHLRCWIRKEKKKCFQTDVQESV